MKYEKYYKGRNDLFSGIVLSAFSIAYLIRKPTGWIRAM